LLQDDSELAFIISHEVAHVILEHSGPGKEAQIKDKVVRQRIEIEADELGVLLMARAGFDPAAAARAESRRYQTNGPVTRGLGLNGVYMPPKERDAFLAKRADEVRLQLEAEAGKR
jgi:predicted Zn-dependent protease